MKYLTDLAQRVRAAARQWLVDLLLSGLKALGHKVQAEAMEVMQAARALEISRGKAWDAAGKAFRTNLITLADELATLLETAERTGSPEDKPEGMRIIALSDTLARALASRLRAAIGGESK